MSEIITVAEVSWAQPGQKKGRIKDTNGKVWYVWNDKMPQFAPGASFNILNVDTFQTDRGNTLYTIKAFSPAAGARGMATGQQQVNQVVARPTMQPPSNNEHRMDIFICGAINNMLSNPNVQPTDLTMMDMVDAIHKFKSAWLAVFGPAPLPRQPSQVSTLNVPSRVQPGETRNEDMGGDEIPF